MAQANAENSHPLALFLLKRFEHTTELKGLLTKREQCARSSAAVEHHFSLQTRGLGSFSRDAVICHCPELSRAPRGVPAATVYRPARWPATVAHAVSEAAAAFPGVRRKE